MNDRILFRTVGGPALGHGHLRRCLALASLARERGRNPVMLIDSEDPGVVRAMDTSGIEWRRLPPGGAYNAEPEIAESLGLNNSDALIFDLSNSASRARVEEFSQATRVWRRMAERIAIIDGLMEECLSDAADLDVDLVVLPYAGAENQAVITAAEVVRGPAYFVLDSCYRGIPNEHDTAGARRILISAGGSDPAGVTMGFMEALARIGDRELEIRVIVGPSFDAGLQASIGRSVKGICHDTELVHAPDNLVEHIVWCDLGLGATGLTKYEMAYMGKPSMLLAMDPLHERLNQAFVDLGATHYLGIAGTLSCEAIALEIVSLLDDAPRREAMAERAGALVDGLGADRFLDLIEGAAAHG